MSLSRFAAGLALVLALALSSCSKEGNPVALPTDPGGSSSPLALTVKADQSQLTAGSTAPATLTVTAKRADGTPATDGTTVALNTSLGAFSFDTMGQPVLLTSVTLTNGVGTAQFFAGSTAGTANIMASMGTTIASLNLPIVVAPAAPVAEFTFSASGLTVLFTDASTGGMPASWSWDFGDGATSTSRNPSHTYANAGSFAVTLTVANSGGQSVKSKFVQLSLGTAPTAAFDFTVTGHQVNFVDQSMGATSWSWNFGDGSMSTDRNPIHIYSSSGAYTVTLTAMNAGGSATANKVVTIAGATPPTAKFTFAVTGQQVNFVDLSTGAPTSWVWNFGDGLVSNQQNPIHVYASPGAYTVTLLAINSAGSSAASDVVTIAATAPPKSAFTFKANGLTVNFADASTGGPTTWSWDFGDGTTSGQQNPIHPYATAGNYTVTLTVSNAGGSSASTQIVTVTAPPSASFLFSANSSTRQAHFTDTSAGNPTVWKWDFGDTTSSAEQNPIHTYAAAGTYTVTLTVTNAAGSSSTSHNVTLAPLAAAFTFSANNATRQVNFTDTSTGGPTAWSWTFGDTGTSTLQNPSHTYTLAGTYTVTLTVTNASGSNSTSRTVTLP
jgi:PKD repeat protein